MTEPMLSVRGEAGRLVDPDYAVLTGHIRVGRESKAAALADAAAAQSALTTDLSTLGAVAATVRTSRSALTWSVPSVTTEIEHGKHPDGEYGPTGRIIATAALVVVVRDFTLLDDLGSALARQESLVLNGVSWEVDDDNPAWPEVRAEAIHAAIAKGRDYAAALGSVILGVDHIADTGLLSGDSTFHHRRSVFASSVAIAGGGVPDSPSLDPVPQELVATIEARFTAAAVPPTALT